MIYNYNQTIKADFDILVLKRANRKLGSPKLMETNSQYRPTLIKQA